MIKQIFNGTIKITKSRFIIYVPGPSLIGGEGPKYRGNKKKVDITIYAIKKFIEQTFAKTNGLYL